jgi:hypothetical protein
MKRRPRKDWWLKKRLLVEIVRPGTGDPVELGEVGEVVVTSFNPDYPLDPFRDRRSLGHPARPFALRTQQYPSQGLDGAG